jgi:hypothetical protein
MQLPLNSVRWGKEVIMSKRTLLLIMGALLLGLIVGYAFPHQRDEAEANCPTVLNRPISTAPALYYVIYHDDPPASLFRLDASGSEEIAQLYDWLRWGISPDGSQAFLTKTGEESRQISLFRLPAFEEYKTIPYMADWEPQGYAGWIDDVHITFNIENPNSNWPDWIILNTQDATFERVLTPEPADIWRDTFSGEPVFSDDFEYVVYPSSQQDPGLPSPHTGFAYLILRQVNEPYHQVKFRPGYANSVRWIEGGHQFVFQASNNMWFLIDAEIALENWESGYPKNAGIRLFYDDVRVIWGNPALSPDIQYLAAHTFLPDQQSDGMFVLQRDGNRMVDLCLRGNFGKVSQDANGSLSNGVWSDDSRYLAVEDLDNPLGQNNIYIYDVQTHSIFRAAQSSKGEDIEIVGWGN